jgi:hypothetical protein
LLAKRPDQSAQNSAPCYSVACSPSRPLQPNLNSRVQAHLQPATGAMVGGLVELQIDVLTDTWFTSAPTLPDLKLEGALVTPPDGQAQHLNQTLDGQAFNGMRYSYLITPNVAQGFDIPPLTMRATPGKPLANSVRRAHRYNSAPPNRPASNPARRRWWPAQYVSPDSAQFLDPTESRRQHHPSTDPASRWRTGDGVADPDARRCPGLSRYPKTPQVSNLDDGRGNLLGGQRIDSRHLPHRQRRLATPCRPSK